MPGAAAHRVERRVEEVLFAAVRESTPARVLEVGVGAGGTAQRIRDELGCNVVGVDISERMVELTRSRGVAALRGDIGSIPFDDASFDCVVAGWILHHVRDVDRALAECARVLRAAGRLVAATQSDESMSDLWSFVGAPPARSLSFSTSNGRAHLERHFDRVEAREVPGRLVFRTPDELRAFVAAAAGRRSFAAQVPDFAAPVAVRTHHTVFVADR